MEQEGLVVPRINRDQVELNAVVLVAEIEQQAVAVEAQVLFYLLPDLYGLYMNIRRRICRHGGSY